MLTSNCVWVLLSVPCSDFIETTHQPMSASLIMGATGCSLDRDCKTRYNKGLLASFDNMLSSLFHENV